MSADTHDVRRLRLRGCGCAHDVEFCFLLLAVDIKLCNGETAVHKTLVNRLCSTN
jgi:hypothetical protein